MRKRIRKILKETYEKNLLSDICNRISTGNNKESPIFMKKLFIDIMNTNLSDDIKNDIKKIFNDWETDMFYSVNNGRSHKNSLYDSTGDSESDISDMYLSRIQSKVCQIFMEMD